MKSFEYLILTFIMTTTLSSGYVMFGGRDISTFAAFYFGASIGLIITIIIKEFFELRCLKKKEREIKEEWELFVKEFQEK